MPKTFWPTTAQPFKVTLTGFFEGAFIEMSLSLCMIVRDEAAVLARCLQSVQGLVDEQIVVDTGSQDETAAIARSFGARIYDFVWRDDFAAARNYSLAQVTGDWVLVLDADEELLPAAVPAIKQAIKDPNILLFQLLREEVGSQRTPISLVSRLFRNHPQMTFKRPYHELVDDSVVAIQRAEPHWQIGQISTLALRHEGYQQQRLQSKEKLARAQRMLEKGLRQHPEDAYLLSKLGGLYYEQNRWSEALALIQRGIALPNVEAAVRYELNYHLGLIYARQKDWRQTELAYKTALAQDCDDLLKVGAFMNLGCLYLDHGAASPAMQLLGHVIRLCPGVAIAHYNLGLALKSLNRLQEAAKAYQQAIELDPTYAAAYQNLGVALFKLRKVSESRTAFEQAIQLYEQQDPTTAETLRSGVRDLGL
ncbi:TPR domain-containing glycosyltransferase [Lyngbya confervoides]|uniref:Tetratricopeptide repeat protein n=1 Tax=Lyngbya confervoides BDU141951 TaxID=1574623 RepID=A0ABD4T8D4_9CYAN|nr:TPR domain-containing glycosyltransferase [Lyngbya confervoides]MCM1984847.1 tetratricopeptide repeat protein [Lyngbya confervoides BDU141951]